MCSRDETGSMNVVMAKKPMRGPQCARSYRKNKPDRDEEVLSEATPKLMERSDRLIEGERIDSLVEMRAQRRGAAKQR